MGIRDYYIKSKKDGREEEVAVKSKPLSSSLVREDDEEVIRRVSAATNNPFGKFLLHCL